MKNLFLSIAIWFVKDHIIDCKIRGDFLESPRYREDLEQCIRLLDTIKGVKRIR